MNRIASFCVDHTRLPCGMYTSRQDGDIVTYDIRMRIPNGGDYLSPAALHTFEHLFATFARNSAVSENVVYVGPMGCRTGFYLVVRDLPQDQAIALVQESFAFIAAYEGDIPGATEPECGNYAEQDLCGAKADAAAMLPVLASWTPEKLEYPAYL